MTRQTVWIMGWNKREEWKKKDDMEKELSIKYATEDSEISDNHSINNLKRNICS